MNILFVNPPSPDGYIYIRDTNRSGRRSRANTIWPQTSLAMLAAVFFPIFAIARFRDKGFFQRFKTPARWAATVKQLTCDSKPDDGQNDREKHKPHIGRILPVRVSSWIFRHQRDGHAQDAKQPAQKR